MANTPVVIAASVLLSVGSLAGLELAGAFDGLRQTPATPEINQDARQNADIQRLDASMSDKARSDEAKISDMQKRMNDMQIEIRRQQDANERLRSSIEDRAVLENHPRLPATGASATAPAAPTEQPLAADVESVVSRMVEQRLADVEAAKKAQEEERQTKQIAQQKEDHIKRVAERLRERAASVNLTEPQIASVLEVAKQDFDSRQQVWAKVRGSGEPGATPMSRDEIQGEFKRIDDERDVNLRNYLAPEQLDSVKSALETRGGWGGRMGNFTRRLPGRGDEGGDAPAQPEGARPEGHGRRTR